MRDCPANELVVHSQRLALQIERYHTWPRVTHQSVGEHTAQVMRIYVQLFGCPRAEVWLAILEHDMPEMRIGDLPFSGDYAPELVDAKRRVEERVKRDMDLRDPELTEAEKRRVKLCDLMDCLEWGAHEERMGNSFGATVALNVEPVICEMAAGMGALEPVNLHIVNVRRHP